VPPFSFASDDYVQILTDIATRLGPSLGWMGISPAPGGRAPETPMVSS
jgi:hypothetical protein